MWQRSVIPERFRVFSGSMLKLIAVVTMIIDHIGCHLVDRSFVLLTVGTYSLTLYRLMRDIGRFAFPIYCFLLIEGFFHTRSRKRYAISLLVLALISEVPYELEHAGKVYFHAENIFFTLLLGLLAFCAVHYLREKPLKMLLSLLGLAAVTAILDPEYGVVGFCFMLTLYALREQRILRIFTALMLNNYRFTMLAFLPISLYNGKRGFIRGPFLKYLFYLIYPVHIFIIYLIKARYIGFQ